MNELQINLLHEQASVSLHLNPLFTSYVILMSTLFSNSSFLSSTSFYFKNTCAIYLPKFSVEFVAYNQCTGLKFISTVFVHVCPINTYMKFTIYKIL